jgi:hypothetical protein
MVLGSAISSDDGAQGEGLGRLVPKTQMERADRWIELASALLLAFATVAIAWSGYQATRWSGEQSNAAAAASAERAESIRDNNLANTQAAIDLSLFTEWANATVDGDAERARFYRQRFRTEFEAPFQEWLALDPFENPAAPAVPLALDSYQDGLEAGQSADALEASAEASAQRARTANQRADNYVLIAVLLATVLFFAGISTKFSSRRLQAGGLLVALFILCGSIVWMLTLPVSFAV